LCTAAGGLGSGIVPPSPARRALEYSSERVRKVAQAAGADVGHRSYPSSALRPSKSPVRHSVNSALFSSIPNPGAVDDQDMDLFGQDIDDGDQDVDITTGGVFPSDSDWQRTRSGQDALLHLRVCDEFLRAYPQGTLPTYVDRHQFKHDRNKRECVALANFIDMSRSIGGCESLVEAQCRRLMGVMHGDETGNWNYCDALDTSAHQRSAIQYLSENAMTRVYRQALLLEKVQKVSASKASGQRRSRAGTGASNQTSSSASTQPAKSKSATAAGDKAGKGKSE